MLHEDAFDRGQAEALPPNSPPPMTVKSSSDARKLRSNAGYAPCLSSAIGPNTLPWFMPAAYTQPRSRQAWATRAIAMVYAASRMYRLRFRRLADGQKRGRHHVVELAQYLVLLPEVVHVALYLLQGSCTSPPPAFARKSGITKIFRSRITWSASGVVGPLAPSAMIRTRFEILWTVSPVTMFSSAAGIRISTSCSIHTSPGSRS